ncbi:lipoate--protein ligase [Parasphaerochaeta coccoides]|uniref:lipoate--protein ligase n=1 Tax=Parasphaerochaeta coccoides (strain ATCC BAA-1237 / DSM 17374 / SPN1) TaxID=760011 RepID=F4GLN0_PARC1|nr:lipoate--protein ligase [Parasphaerochaeta coccoides]AEC02424.1 lipoyltransferase and lipoate-protein ligase [Parasphaerochaeta coccoides DSM 17374]
MRYLLNPSVNPYYNLALDEYAMKHIDEKEDFFFLWQNEPSIIIGKNQTTLEEINSAFVEERGIHVARRVSGGGAVYHDLGNLNFTFILNVDDLSRVNFFKYVQPVIDALATLGVKAELSGRNDILIDGKKISGNAQRIANGRLMHHGTLLFDENLDDLVAALNVNPDKISSKGSKSVRSRVTNIREHLPKDMDIRQFWDALHYYLSDKARDTEIILTSEQKAAVQKEADERFSTWGWIYGASPAFNVHVARRFPGGKIEAYADVGQGLIRSIRFIGDYLGLHDVVEIEERLRGEQYSRWTMEKILGQFTMSQYFGTITQAEIISLLFD